MARLLDGLIELSVVYFESIRKEAALYRRSIRRSPAGETSQGIGKNG
jgi:hypothetical protein